MGLERGESESAGAPWAVGGKAATQVARDLKVC